MAASGTAWQQQAGGSARCLLCSLVLLCAQKVQAGVPDERPRLWVAPPVYAAAPGELLLATPSLHLVSSALFPAGPSLHGLIGLSAQRGPSVRGGVGLDLDLPDAGKLHLDLLPARDAASPGMRWQLAGDDRLLQGKLWSLGGCLDVIRSRKPDGAGYGQRQLQLAPQLILDADRLLGADGTGRLILQRSHWSELSGRDTGAGAVWQLRLVWRF